MLTEDFKKRAFEKLNNVTPEHMIEVLKTIGSVQVGTSIAFFDNGMVELKKCPVKVDVKRGWIAYRNLSLVAEDSISFSVTNNIEQTSNIIDCEEGYVA